MEIFIEVLLYIVLPFLVLYGSVVLWQYRAERKKTLAIEAIKRSSDDYRRLLDKQFAQRAATQRATREHAAQRGKNPEPMDLGIKQMSSRQATEYDNAQRRGNNQTVVMYPYHGYAPSRDIGELDHAGSCGISHAANHTSSDHGSSSGSSSCGNSSGDSSSSSSSSDSGSSCGWSD